MKFSFFFLTPPTHASFNKAAAHEIVKDLKADHLAVLSHFKVAEKKRKFTIWQRDPLAVTQQGLDSNLLCTSDLYKKVCVPEMSGKDFEKKVCEP